MAEHDLLYQAIEPALPSIEELIGVYRQAAADHPAEDSTLRAHFGRLAVLDKTLAVTRGHSRRFVVAADLYERTIAEIHKRGLRG